MDLEEGDLVLCTVDRIVGTTVFVKIEGNGEGSIIFSEISPGRIRNIRDYVVPKKKIVCKVLRIKGNRIELSYRRVNQEGRKEILNKYKKGKSYENMLKSILGEDKSEKVIEKISKQNNIYDFFQEAKENPKKLEKILDKKDVEKIFGILKAEKPKKTEVKKEIMLKSQSENGLDLIKNIFKPLEKRFEIKYLSGGKYILSKESEDAKKSDSELQNALKKVEKSAKKHNMEFSIIKK